MSKDLPSKILVVDSDKAVLNFLKKGLESYKINVTTSDDYGSALYLYNNNRFDACLVSKTVSDLPGLSLFQKWRSHEISSKRFSVFIMMSGQKQDVMTEALRNEMGDIGVIVKPINIAILVSLLLKSKKSVYENEALFQLKETLITPMLEKGQFAEASKIAESNLQSIGTKGRFLNVQLQKEAGFLDKALSLLDELLKNDNNNLSFLNEKASILLKKGELEEACKLYEEVDKLAPSHIERIQNLAELHLKTKNPEKSIEKFQELIDLNPENPELKFDIYEKISDSGYLKEAQRFCKKTSTSGELVKHYNNKGVVLSKNGAYQNAIDEYEKAVILIPNSKDLYRIIYNMALAHINLKSRDDLFRAKKLLEESYKLNPNFDKAREKLDLVSSRLK